MRRFLVISAAVIGVMAFSCKSKKVAVSPNDAVSTQAVSAAKDRATEELRYFDLGSGGGVTGKYEEFRIYNSGKVQLKRSEKEGFVDYGSVSKSVAADLFQQHDDLQLMYFKLKAPGNMTYYLEVHDAEAGISNKIVWGGSPVKPEVQAFFDAAFDLARGSAN